jgi:hypothetical protein
MQYFNICLYISFILVKMGQIMKKNEKEYRRPMGPGRCRAKAAMITGFL